MRKVFFNKKWYMSIVSLLFVAIIPLCSINLYNYSQVLSTTSQEETLDDEQNNVGEGIDTSENNDDDEATTQASGYWTDSKYATKPGWTSRGFQINSAGDLAWIATQSDDEDVMSRTFNLTANIDLSAHYWVPIMNFAGTFNGNGYTISGLTINESHTFDVSHVLKENGREVTYPNCIKVYSNDYHFLYGLIGHVSGSAEINNVIVSGNITLSFNVSSRQAFHSYIFEVLIGGVVGGVLFTNDKQTLTMTNCVSKVVIKSTLSNSGAGFLGSLSDTLIVGGIVGLIGNHEQNGGVGPADRVLVQNCINFANVNTTTIGGGKYTTTAGIVGQLAFGEIIHCVNYGYVTGAGKATGGIVAVAPGVGGTGKDPDYSASITDCLNFGDIQGKKDESGEPCTGGVVGVASDDENGSSQFSYVAHCANFGDVSGCGGLGEIVGCVGGDGAQIDYCYTRQINHDGAVNWWIGRYDDSVAKGDKDNYFSDGTGTAKNNKYYTGYFDDYMDLLGNANYSGISLGRAWTGMEFRSPDVTATACQNSKFPVTLSWFVKDMEIDVKIWEDDKLVDFTGNDFNINEARGLERVDPDRYLFYSTITTSPYDAFEMINGGLYTVTVYEKDTSEENNLGRVIIDPTTEQYIDYTLTMSSADESTLNQGTYSGNFTDIIIVLEKDIPDPSDIEIWTSDYLYDGDEYKINGLKLSTKGGYAEVESLGDRKVTITITANPGYEFIGLFADEDLENEEIPIASRRIERFNDLTYDEYLDDIPEEDIENLPNIPAKRVDVKTSAGFRKYEYTLDYSALITGMKIVPVGEESASGQDEVSANARNNFFQESIYGSGGGNSSYDDQKQEDENKEEEEKFKYIVESIEYVSSLDVAFVAYRQDYNLNVTYQGAGAETIRLEKGFRDRARLAQRDSYEPRFYYADITTEAKSLTLESGSKYFSSSSFVEYVADVSGAVEGYWSSSYGSSVRGMTFKNSYVELSPSEFFAYADPWSYTTITFKYCESPRYDYTYTIYITDAYEEYGSGQYLPGQLVGETDYYGYTMISKENISVDLPSGELVSLPATKIPVGATYREVFDFNRNNILSSDFISGLVDTSKIIAMPFSFVGGGLIRIDYTLSEVARRYEKEPLTGYKEEDGYCLSDDYSDTNTTMLANTTLRDIINMYGDLSEDGCSVTLYSFFHLRDPYKIEFQTMVDGELVTLSMPANSDEYILTANDSNMTSNSLDFTCEPFDLINVDVTDKLVYRYDGQKTTFYSFDCMTVGDSVLSESGTYSFQGIPTNDIEEFVIAVNFKEEFTIDNRILNSDTSISYNSSIWYVDSATDLLNIAYRVYCQGLPLAKKIVQTADIDFEGGYMLPIGTESQPFSSVYDGQYYRIENMSIVGGTADDIGLFGYTKGATIKNLTLMNADVSGGYNVGAVAGYATNTTFERVGSYNGIVSAMDVQTAGRGIFLTNGVTAVNVTKQNGTYTSISLGNNGTSYTTLSVMVADEIVNDSDRAYYIGDLIGRGDNVTIKICFVRKSNTINAEIGGFAGLLANSQVTNTYTSRSDFGNTTGTTLTHTHTDITDISTCPDCDDVFIW